MQARNESSMLTRRDRRAMVRAQADTRDSWLAGLQLVNAIDEGRYVVQPRHIVSSGYLAGRFDKGERRQPQGAISRLLQRVGVPTVAYQAYLWHIGEVVARRDEIARVVEELGEELAE